MPNSAYLYSSDQPDIWEEPEEDIYISRWVMPLAWFFFYQPWDVRLVDVQYNNSHWQEVKLAAEKQAALELFKARRPLLFSLANGRLSHEKIAAFTVDVERWPGRFLLMDPDEVLGGLSDAAHMEQFVRLLTLLGPGGGPPEPVWEVAQQYVGDFSPDQDRCEGQIIGYTYSGQSAQAALHPCINRVSFRSVTVDPTWLSSTVVQLATNIYAERAFDHLPILADALQDAGCNHPDVLHHCRCGGPHFQGCWVVELLMGKT